MPRWRPLLSFVLVLAGCDPGGGMGIDAGPDAMVPEARVELGTGTSTFVALPATGAELELVHGPQGGYHVFVTARLYGLEPEGLSLTFDAADADTGAAVGHRTAIGLVAARVQREGDHYVRAGDILILDDGNPDNVRGHTLDVTVTATEADTGRSASDHRVALIVDNEGG